MGLRYAILNSRRQQDYYKDIFSWCGVAMLPRSQNGTEDAFSRISVSFLTPPRKLLLAIKQMVAPSLVATTTHRWHTEIPKGLAVIPTSPGICIGLWTAGSMIGRVLDNDRILLDQ